MDPSFFKSNRRRLYNAASLDNVLVAAHLPLQESADVAFGFRQDSNFWYLTGLDEPAAVLWLHKNGATLATQPRSRHAQLWEGQATIEELQTASGVDEVITLTDLWRRLRQLPKRQTFGALQPMTRRQLRGTAPNPARQLLWRQLCAIAGHAPTDVRPNLVAMRSIKQTPEITALNRAVQASLQAFADLEKQLNTFATEAEIAAFLGWKFTEHGGDGHAYPPIVAADQNACTLHYSANKASLKQAKSVLIDAAAKQNHYHSDITRSYWLAKTSPAPLWQTIYDIAATAQELALSLIKPGQQWPDYEKQVRSFIVQRLKEENIITGPTDPRLAQMVPHATSHALGLDVHDAHDYGLPMAQNMVLTVEPGIYLPKEGFGVRIEDDVMVTASGYQPLG